MSSPIAPPARAAVAARRIVAVDALRGLVILLMLVDHARETYFLHHQVPDPMDLSATSPALALTRLASHLCAPVFVALTGLSAWLYADARGGRAAASSFLLKRGLFLIVLELTVVSFAWGFDPTPPRYYLQVIWAIGVAMIALSALVHLPRAWIAAIGAAIVLGHNLLDPVAAPASGAGRLVWAILHERQVISLGEGVTLRTSYPVLPWIGVIALGWAIGPWFARDADAGLRRRRLIAAGVLGIAAFVGLRLANGYGDPHPWSAAPDALGTVVAFLNVTKYPPSADFLLATLGAGALLMVALERVRPGPAALLAVFGGAPLFFYLLHLFVLTGSNRLIGVLTGAEGNVGVPHVWMIWAIAAVVAVPCWFACRRFAAVKRASGAAWMRYL